VISDHEYEFWRSPPRATVSKQWLPGPLRVDIAEGKMTSDPVQHGRD